MNLIIKYKHYSESKVFYTQRSLEGLNILIFPNLSKGNKFFVINIIVMCE